MKYVQPIRDREKIEAMKEFLYRQSPRNHFLFVLGINTGLRISDLLPLQVQNVRGKEYLTLYEQKTGKANRIRLNQTLKNAIQTYTRDMLDDEYLFPSYRTDKPITRIQAYRILQEAAAAVGLDSIGTHTLRKTFGYFFYQKTKDVALLQSIFNHSAPSITLRYIGITQDIIDQAIEEFGL
jgi:integrase